MRTQGLSGAINFYLQSRRRLGFALQSQGRLLGNLAHYARHCRHRGPLTIDLALRWVESASPDSPGRRARRLEIVRHFALFWQAFDDRTQVPPSGLYGPKHRRVAVHIYTPREITALLEAAQEHSLSQSPHLSPYVTLFGLLASTGLRISEALGLQSGDWDSRQAVLTIRRSKSGESRYVPVTPSVARVLNQYTQARSQGSPCAHSKQFFLDEKGRSLRYAQVNRMFCRLRKQLGWQSQRPRPRLHDLRHTFAVTTLVVWYRQGQAELNAKILSLAVYLGHRNIGDTYWYLTAVPELLALGCSRWAQALGQPFHRGCP